MKVKIQTKNGNFITELAESLSHIASELNKDPNRWISTKDMVIHGSSIISITREQ